VSVAALASATNALKAKVRYQQKALDTSMDNIDYVNPVVYIIHDTRNKINVGIELKIPSLKSY